MSYAEATAYLEALGIDAMKSMSPSLHRIEALCAALGHPERSIQAVHITGTNGKTSTARMVSALIQATGLTVATYTSPHLEDLRERLVINGEPVDKEAFGEIFAYVRRYLELVEAGLGETLSYFELLTAMFFVWTTERAADAMVVEVGLGGRWDATNVISAPVSVVTNIGVDHLPLLGADRIEVAREKSGIVKRDGVAVTGERDPQVLDTIAAEAVRVGASLSVLDRDFHVRENSVAVGGRFLTLEAGGVSYPDLFLPLHGAHQGTNAAIALEAVARFLPTQELALDVVAEGFAKTVVPGRLETIAVTDAGVRVVLDVAHNPDGMSALVAALVGAFAFDQVRFVLGILHDKDYVGMLKELGRIPCSVVATRAKTMRSVPLDELQSAAQQLGLVCTTEEDVATAVKVATAQAVEGELVCITGSHYVVGEGRSYLR